MKNDVAWASDLQQEFVCRMCRFLAYLGEPIFLENVVITPCHSLVHQSICATQAKTTTNGDGFGIGWYGERAEPGIYRELRPAWSDENLLALCAQVRASLFFAHVRAATGTATARANCHPFGQGRCLFMHNGQVGGYARIRRLIEGMIPNELYEKRVGTTDSEAIFLAAMAHGAEEDAPHAFAQVLQDIKQMMERANIQEALRFAAVFTNGDVLHAFRWSSDDKPPTLYWREQDGNIHVVSEPLDEMPDFWHLLPQSSSLIAQRGKTPELRRFL